MTTNTRTLQLPAIGLGTWQLQYDDGVRAVRIAIEKGYRHIDTAARYGRRATAQGRLCGCSRTRQGAVPNMRRSSMPAYNPALC
ncbi:hypothetical protein WJ33_30925 [Burkholderia ubonensis]|uniref:NADP-dependent oxidoreductase domain-containing protein n=1 Tax=Burkholderia ubonensis TaxID=101571 RepID=A0A124R9L3_9BURK|nr:aldo/keto reductase [Burkholderia ubonensis]KVG61759.1 hypothetical protein WJ33_30925 [Burkholderia ubonensis]